MIQTQLRAVLKEKGWTQKHLAELLGYPLATVENWFMKKRYRRPCIKDLEKIAELAEKRIVFIDKDS